MTHHTSTPTLGDRRPISLSLLATALLALAATALAPASASAAPPVLWQSQVSQTQGEAAPGARSVAANPANGRLYVLDQRDQRVVELSAWGIFIRTWGWDVVESGPGDNPSDELEICVPADGDVCKPGTAGSGAGQLTNPLGGIALDSAGNVYVAEVGGTPTTATGQRKRVQKFSPTGEFLLMFGAGVNQGGGSPESPGDVCTAEHLENGDTCGNGTIGTGPAEFGEMSSIANRIAIDPEDRVWVGDVERIQRFDTGGVYQGEIALPANPVNSLAVDSSGDLYAAYEAGINVMAPDVHKLDPVSGEELATYVIANPAAIDLAPNGEVYAFDEASAKIYRFAPGGTQLEAFGEGLDRNSTGLAVNDVTGEGGIAIYHSNDRPSFLRAYSPPPDPAIVGPPPAVPPTIVDQGATSVGFTEATLQVKLNPEFWENATYFAQYATAACIEAEGWEAPCVAEQPAAPGVPLAAGVTNTPVTRELDIAGLAPNTAYRFRFVASSSGGGPTIGSEGVFVTYRLLEPNTSCPNQAHRNGPAARLPDCRAYEMVSPLDKNGGDIMVGVGMEGLQTGQNHPALDQSAPGGSKLAYSSGATFAGALGSPTVSQYIAARGPSGWVTEAINPPMRGGGSNNAPNLDSQFKAFSEDLCQGWLAAESGLPLTSPLPVEGFRNLYRRDNCATSANFTWLESSAPEPEPCAPVCPEGDLLFPELQGVAADGSCAVFRVNDALTPEAPRGVQGGSSLSAPQVYLWCEDVGVRLVSVLPNGTPFVGYSSAGTEYPTNAPLGGVGGRLDRVENALSEDGRRLYWTTSSGPDRLYVRVNADRPQSAISGGECTEPARACTLPVSEAVPTGQPAQFWTASRDGGRAIFSIIGPGSLAGNLYEYDLAARKTTLIATRTLGVAGTSEDATHVYFVSREDCGGEAEAGKPNLYLYEAGESCAAGELAFVATLAEEDISAGGTGTGRPSPVAVVPRDHIARTTPDGSHLAFVSAARLTPYDNRDAASGKADRQVYLYDATADELRCPSCNPSGARPQGAGLGVSLWTAAYIPGYQHHLYGRRMLSEDGRRLFFNAIDALVPQDINDAQDVYQWEAPGTGDCTTASPTHSAQNEGCVSLVSSGESPQDSEFIDASASGDDVFIRTASSLDPRDPGLIDIYDARVNGGIPLPADPAACEGEACQSPPPAPVAPVPASAGFRGAGNAAPPARSCRAAPRRARRLSRKAKRSRRAARRAKAPARSRKLRRRAKRSAKGARRHAKRAKRCRAARKRANPNRRAGR